MQTWKSIFVHRSAHINANLLLISLYLHRCGDSFCFNRNKIASLQITPLKNIKWGHKNENCSCKKPKILKGNIEADFWDKKRGRIIHKGEKYAKTDA